MWFEDTGDEKKKNKIQFGFLWVWIGLPKQYAGMRACMRERMYLSV